MAVFPGELGLSPVSTAELTGDHGPSTRLVETRARQHGLCWRVMETRARQHGLCWRVMETGHPSTGAVNSGRQLG